MQGSIFSRSTMDFLNQIPNRSHAPANTRLPLLKDMLSPLAGDHPINGVFPIKMLTRRDIYKKTLQTGEKDLYFLYTLHLKLHHFI